jgi:predicted AAA+ superfamily ATPase
MPTIHISQLYKLELIHKYIEKNYDRCRHTIHTLSVVQNQDKSIGLSVSHENGVFQWEDDGETYEMEYKKEGNPCPRENTYFTSCFISHPNIETLKGFMSKIFNGNKKLSIYTSCAHGYWNQYEMKNMNKNKMEHLFLPTNITKTLIDMVDAFDKPETQMAYDSRGDTYKKVFLLAGIPGSGKSSLIKAMAAQYNRNIYYLNFSKKLVDDIFVDIMNKVAENCILVIEDIDSYFDEEGKTEVNITQSMLLNVLDGAYDNCLNNVLIFITANDINKIDYRVKRPGRINKIFTFDYPEKSEIEQCFGRYATGDFEAFYQKIKKLKICMAGIKDFLISYPKDHMEHFDELVHDTKERSPSTENADKMFL